MRLIKFTLPPGDGQVHVNPAHIVSVEEVDGAVFLKTTNGSYEITGDIDTILNRINDELKRGEK